ncbi:MAG TPA: hypothetical protein VJ936_00005, partial [Desulfobacteraceae bacterium]|nr:hypothetical protein [Desulfobacteraceae bacterium]
DFLTGYAATVSTLFADHFSREKTPFVLRTGLKTVNEVTHCLNTTGNTQKALSFLQKQLPLIIDLHQTSEVLSVRRWAASARESLILQTSEPAVAFKEKIEAVIPRIKPGKSRRIPRAWLAALDEETAGRVLSLVAGSDFSLGIGKGVMGSKLSRGDVFGFRIWRFLHEIASPSPDKRQGFSHLTGRNFTSPLRAPSATGSELTQTKVPGEPLYFDTESGWRPYLPLVDEFACCAKRLFSRKPIKIFTPEGTTEIAPPSSLPASLGAWLAVTFRFRHYAELRNWHEGDQSRPDGYITAMEKLGFRIAFSGVDTPVTRTKDKDPSVSRFFPVALPLLSPDLIPQIKHYFFSAYENTLYELGLFAGLLLLIFLYKHLVYSRRVVRARKKIRLVIGGWGTRGKSGVERLKAAVFEAVGHGFVNKTTGCEAMFLHAVPFGKTREMFLFRPYDKATIWEHHHLICMTAALRAKLFLWECMALTPSFVSILQKHWTRDDISTITNTYPDHEDIQGPAGINIPQVMTNFIPEKATLITSEEEMTPILTEAARTRKTRIECTGWLEAGLLTPDVLGRFPYEEHPSNVALVLRMAETVGINPDFALREMADRVVPDIGALKVFPQAPIKQRRLEFVNGMSANERFATMSNWQRMGFASHTADKEPGTVISTLVNNRADRITRSRMFADIIVNDLAADLHFLIGSNLSGLSGFIDTAWSAFLRKNSLFSTQDTPADEKFTAMARRLKIPVSSRTLTNRLVSMLNSLGMELDPADVQAMMAESPGQLPSMLEEKGIDPNTALDIARHAKQWNEAFTEYQDFLTRIRTHSGETSPSREEAAQTTSLEQAYRTLVTGWFKRKIVVIDNPHATGNQIIHVIQGHTPPGTLNRIMGLQNIKGPGLDFVYRWQAWESCYLAGRKILNDGEPEVFNQGFNELTAFQEYGILCEDYVLDLLDQTTGKIIAQTEKYQAGFSLIRTSLETAMAKIGKDLKTAVPENSIKNRITSFVESLLDAGDAVKRRKRANLIYKDLIHERISHDRAAIELKKLNQRQKGGWLGR